MAPTLVGEWRYHSVPAGYREVIKCVTITNLGAAAGNTLVTVAEAAVFFPNVPAATTLTYSSLMLPVYEGEQVGVYMYQSAGGVTISGFRFKEVENLGDDQGELDQGEPGPPPDWLVLG